MVSEVEIFQDGYLKSEYINNNYRGLVGWDCYEYSKYGYCKGGEYKGKILSTNGNELLFQYADESASNKPFNNRYADHKIKKFTPDDIPKGELCWFKRFGHWHLEVFHSVDLIHYDKPRYFSFGDKGLQLQFLDNITECVPYLIAETSEDAEKLKNWK